MKYYMIKKDGEFKDVTRYGTEKAAIDTVKEHKHWENKYTHEYHEYEIVEFNYKKGDKLD